jgi:hypothetical protein
MKSPTYLSIQKVHGVCSGTPVLSSETMLFMVLGVMLLGEKAEASSDAETVLVIGTGSEELEDDITADSTAATT